MSRVSPFTDTESGSAIDWPEDSLNKDLDIRVSPEIDREIDVVERLEELDCSCTPILYDWKIMLQPEPAKVHKGYLFILLMEKVPGRNLDNFNTLSLKERDRVRIAFAKAMM